MDKAKLQEVFSDKEYVEGIAKLSPEDAAKSLQAKGVDVTADDLVKVRNFVLAHQEELQNGELSEDALAEIAGGGTADAIFGSVIVLVSTLVAISTILW